MRGDPVCIIRVGDCNLRAAVDQVGEEKLDIWMRYQTECAWQYCDAMTRHNGYLVKQITLIDLRHPPGTGSVNRDKRYMNAFGKNSKNNEWLCPQLSDRVILFNAPTWCKLLWKTVTPFLSKRTLAKISLHKRPAAEGSDTASCPYVERILGEANVPTFFGGTLECHFVEDHLTNYYNRAFGGSGEIAVPIALRRLPRRPQVETGVGLSTHSTPRGSVVGEAAAGITPSGGNATCPWASAGGASCSEEDAAHHTAPLSTPSHTPQTRSPMLGAAPNPLVLLRPNLDHGKGLSGHYSASPSASTTTAPSAQDEGAGQTNTFPNTASSAQGEGAEPRRCRLCCWKRQGPALLD